MIAHDSQRNRVAEDAASFFALVTGAGGSSAEMDVLRSRLESHGLRCQGWVNWETSLAGHFPESSTAHSVIVLFGPPRNPASQGQAGSVALETCLQSLLESCLKERRRIIPVVFPGGAIPQDSVFSVLNPLIVSTDPASREAVDDLASRIGAALIPMSAQRRSDSIRRDKHGPTSLGTHRLQRHSQDLIVAAVSIAVSFVLAATGSPILLALAVIGGLAAYASLVSAARSASEVNSLTWWARILTFLGESLGNEPDRAGHHV